MAEKKLDPMSVIIASLTDKQIESFVATLNPEACAIAEGVIDHYEGVICKLKTEIAQLKNDVMFAKQDNAHEITELNVRLKNEENEHIYDVNWYNALVKSLMIERRAETAHFREDANEYVLRQYETFDGSPVVHIYRKDEVDD